MHNFYEKRFNLKRKGNCKYDYLSIYSLAENDTIANDHGLYCGDLDIDKSILSTTNKIALNFKSDNSVSKTGFSLYFVVGKIKSKTFLNFIVKTLLIFN